MFCKRKAREELYLSVGFLFPSRVDSSVKRCSVSKLLMCSKILTSAQTDFNFLTWHDPFYYLFYELCKMSLSNLFTAVSRPSVSVIVLGGKINRRKSPTKRDQTKQWGQGCSWLKSV